MEIIEIKGKFQVVTACETTNYLGEKHDAHFTLGTFDTLNEAEEFMSEEYERSADEEDFEEDTDPGYTQSEAADDWNTYDWD